MPTSQPPPAKIKAEQSYREAYERGIRRAAPGATFAVVGKIGGALGPALRAHALDAERRPLTGEPLLAWIEAEAHAFRLATAERAQYWGGWSVYFFARWLNERAAGPAKTARESRLQPMSGKKWPV